MASFDSSEVYVEWKGVDAQSEPYNLEPTVAKDARNVHRGHPARLKKREGFVDLTTGTNLTGKLDSVHSLFAANVGSPILLAAGKQAGASNDRLVSVSTGGVCTTLTSALTQGKRWSFVQAPQASGPTEGPIYGVNGTDTPRQWDGSAASTAVWTATTGTIPTSFKYLVYHSDRIWALGSETFKGRVKYSGLTAATIPAPDPHNWDDDFYTDIEPDDGEVTTGGGPIGPDLLVFKARKTYVVHDPATGAWRRISSTTGCISHRSIVETPQGTIFLSEDQGVCIADSTQVQRIGEAVEPFIREAAQTNPTSLPNAVATMFQNRYFLSIPYADADNDLLLEYDLEQKSWWVHSINSNQFALIDPTGAPKLYSANAQATVVQRAFTPDIYADSDDAYDTYWEGPHYVWGDPHIGKRVNQFRMDGVGDWTLKGASTFNDAYNTIDGITWEGVDAGSLFAPTTDDGHLFAPTLDDGELFAPTAGVTERRYYTPLSRNPGRAWSLRIENDDTADMQVFSLSAYFRGRTD